jgi:predicted site-specific integrase-resolvase
MNISTDAKGRKRSYKHKNEELKRMNELSFCGEDLVRDMVGVMDSFDLVSGRKQ